MDKKGDESSGVSFMWLLYLVIAVVILATLISFARERVTGDEFSNLYTANTIGSFYGLAGLAPGDMEIEYTDSKPYSLEIEDSFVSVIKDKSKRTAEVYLIKNGFLSHRDTGAYVNTTITIVKKGDEIIVK